MILIKLKFYHNYDISAPHGLLAKECYPTLLRSYLSEGAFQTNKHNYCKEVSGRASVKVIETSMNLTAPGKTPKGLCHIKVITPY